MPIDTIPPCALNQAARSRRLFALLVLLIALAPAQAGAATLPLSPGPESPFAWVQIIHNVAGLEAVDVYIDNQLHLENLAFETGSPFMPVPSGSHKIDLVAGSDPDNTRPLWTLDITLEAEANYAFVAVGTQDELHVALEDEALREAASEDVEFWIVQGAVDAPPLDIRRLDPRVPNQLEDLLVNNIAFGEQTTYRRLEPMAHDFQVTNADNTAEYARFRYDLGALGGQALVFVLSGRFGDASLRLVGYDADGYPLVEVPVGITDATAQPEAFVLRGNYPNPFNPATTIAFDLHEAATIHLEVVDLLGRTVLTTPRQRLEAGSDRRLGVDASALASGLYLYRLVAQTNTAVLTRAGRLVLAR